MGLPSFSVKHPVFTSMIFLCILIMGIVSVFQLQVELYQGESKGIISVIVRVRGGLPPAEVEKLITKPVEEAVATVSHVNNLYSHSREAESRVTLEFDPGTDMRYAALEVREKFSRVVPKLPTEIEKPLIADFTEGDDAIVVFAVTSEKHASEDVREMVDKELTPILTRIDGVASVEVYGGKARKILVELDRDKMFAYNISIERVMDVLGRSNVNLLAGQVDRGTLEYAVRSMGAFTSVDEIGELGIEATRQGSIIPLKEIATVKDTYMEAEDYARLNLNDNVTVYVKKTSLARTIPVARAVRTMVRDFNARSKGDYNAIIVTDRAHSIEKAIGSVWHSLFEGMFLTGLVIFLFFRNVFFSLVVLLCIPVSVIATFIFMNFFGFSINVMTMSGLALSIGILVDSSICVLQNILKKLDEGMSIQAAAMVGTEEVWMPLITSQATNIIVFLPIVLIDKNIQLMYQGFAFTVTFSLVVSIFVAVMLVPVILSEWLRTHPSLVLSRQQQSQKMHERLKGILDGYVGLCEKNYRHRGKVLLVTLVLFGVALWGLIHKDIDWPTTMEENEFAVVIFPLAGARIEVNDQAVKKVEALLAKIPDVKLFSSTVRKDEIRIFAKLVPRNERKYSKEEIMKLIDEKGNEAVKEVHQNYSLIVDEGAATSGESRKLVINIFGQDNDVLEKLAHEVASRVQKIPGLTNLVMTDLRKRPEYAIVVDKGRAALYGLTVKNIADSTHALVRGMRPTKFHELSKGLEIETITRLQAIYRQKVEDIPLLYISTKEGSQIQLGEVASFRPSFGPQTIDRKDKFRYVFVKGDVHRPLETVAKEARAFLHDIQWPDDYYWRFGGYFEELIKGKSQLSLAVLLSIALCYGTMACLFQSYWQPLVIQVTMPLASIGIWASLTLTRKPMSQPVFIGIILLAGYVVNEAIMLVDRMNVLQKEGMELKASLVKAGLDRLEPILMMRAATVMGFIPMAVGMGEGNELWSPLAITVIGGLLSSTVLTLFVVPDIILFFEEGVFPKIRALLSRKNQAWLQKPDIRTS